MSFLIGYSTRKLLCNLFENSVDLFVEMLNVAVICYDKICFIECMHECFVWWDQLSLLHVHFAQQIVRRKTLSVIFPRRRIR